MFGFPVQAFVEDVENAVLDYIADGMDELEKGVNKTPGAEHLRKDVAASVDTVFTSVQKSMAHFTKKLRDKSLKHILFVPEDLELPHEKKESAKHMDVDEDALTDEIKELYEKIHAARFMNQALRNELSIINHDLERFSGVAMAMEIEQTNININSARKIAEQASAISAEKKMLEDMAIQAKLNAAEGKFPSCRVGVVFVRSVSPLAF